MSGVMQFDTNSDIPTLDAQAPIPFPPVDPSPCARITVRVWHRNTMMTVQNVLVKTSPTATAATATAGATRRTSGILAATLASEFQSNHNNNTDDEDQNMSSSSSSSSDDDDDDDDDEMLDDDVDIAATTATATSTTDTTTSSPPECAYWMQRTIRDAIYGRVVLAVVLTRMPPKSTFSTTAPAAVAEWQVTDQKCAIKEMSWQHIRRERHRLAEDPIQEVAALYYLQQQYFSETTTVPPTATTAATATMESSGWENPFVATTATAAATIATNPMNPDSAMLQTSIQSNILLPLDLLSDDRYLYSILPFCNGGELFDRLDRREKFPEAEARYWMHQILNGVEHLQKAGICHRDLSLENLLVHDSHALVIDMGMCLRIPHVGATEVDSLTTTTTTTTATASIMETTTTSNAAGPLVFSMDQMNLNNATTTTTSAAVATSTIYQTHLTNTAGITTTATITTTTTNPDPFATIDHRFLPRHWMLPQGTCGKWIYMSPEIYKNKQPFDGHAVDMWAVGVILFLMLTGFPPWERACATDERFHYMTQGYLVQMLTEWNLGLSSDAMDLLQRMFWIDPQDRLSLEQVKAHPWMVKPELAAPPPGFA